LIGLLINVLIVVIFTVKCRVTALCFIPAMVCQFNYLLIYQILVFVNGKQYLKNYSMV